MRAVLARWAAALGTVVTDAYLSLTARPGRSTAMIVGIVLGVASATAAVLVADSQQVQIDRRFDAQRSPVVVLKARDAGKASFDRSAADRVRGLEPVAEAGELSIWRESVSVATTSPADTRRAPVIAATAGGLAATGTVASAGLPITALDALDGRPVVWVGHTLAASLGLRLDRPETASLGLRPYTVAGILRSGPGFEYLDNAVVTPAALARRDLDAGTSLRFLIRVRPGSAAAVARYAVPVLDPTGGMGLVDVTPPDGRLLLGTVASDLRRIGLALGALVGLVGMIAVGNTLTMAVNQRSRELGLRAAMGWSRRRIGALILVESAVAGLVAAVIGCGLGLLAALVWSRGQGWELIVAPGLAPTVVLLGTLSSLVGGLLPAIRAASVSPLEALRA